MRLLASLTLLLTLFALPTMVGQPAFGAEAASELGAQDAGHEPNANPLPTPQTGLVTFIVTLLVFGGLVVILGKFAWGPIASGLQAREDKIRDDIHAAEKARADAEASMKENQDRLASAEARIRELMAQAQADGQQLATRIKMQAQSESEELKEKALREIDNSRRQAVEDIHNQAANLATAVAGKILGREINESDQQELVRSSLSQFKNASTN